ncbi:MAG: protein kinase [Myxococcales bacterium]|nr:protein kinase [Myxococcales bacterium]
MVERVQRFGKYELLEKIGAGGMAEIYKARYIGIDGFEKILVLKKILPNFADNTAFIKMLINEAKLTSSLQHVNIVQIFELGEIDDQYYIAMEYVNGKDLLKIMAQASKLRLRVPSKLVAYLLSEVCKGLAYAHSACDSEGNNLNIIHRDVSPSNIIISLQGEVKIMDFGVARATQQNSTVEKTRAGTLKGKLGYMSPEQVTGKTIDHRADIFSLGIVLFEMMTLKRLFLGRTDLDTMINIRDANIEEKFQKYPFIPNELRAILRRALAKDPNQRYQTAEEFHEELLDYLFTNQLKVTHKSLQLYVDALFSKNPREELAVHFPRESFDPNAHAAAGAARNLPAVEARTTDPTPTEPPHAEEPNGTVVPAGNRAMIEPTRHSSKAIADDATNRESGVIDTDEQSLFRSLFRLRDQDGNVVGPISYHSLVNLIQARSIAENELVSIDEKTWVTVQAIPDLAKQFPLEKPSEEERPPRYKGAANPFTMPRLIYRLAINKIDGRLRLVNDTTVKEVWFSHGKPVHVASNMRTELMGEFMVARQFITGDQLEAALKQTAELDGRLGDVLIALKMIQPHQLYEILRQQFVERILEIFTWTRGEYLFYLGDEARTELLPFNITWLEMLTEGARSRVPFPLLEKFFKNHWNKSIEFVDNPYAKLDDFKLNAKEIRVVNLLRNELTLSAVTHVEHVLETIGLNVIYRVLFLLLQTEFVQITD